MSGDRFLYFSKGFTGLAMTGKPLFDIACGVLLMANKSKSERTKNMKSKGYIVPITEEMVRAANMSIESGLTITSLNKAIIITETDVLDHVPDELLDLFDEFGIGETAVRNVLSEDNGILKALASCQQ
jgi:hypothetical protein